MQEIDIHDFLKLKSENIQIIDIREEYEHDEGHISKLNIPMDEILDSIEKIERYKPVIIYCNSGKRGAAVVHILRKKYSMKNISNLSGGYQAYIDKIQ
jgi:adenylyltransferase/sulfurtransferase